MEDLQNKKKRRWPIVVLMLLFIALIVFVFFELSNHGYLRMNNFHDDLYIYDNSHYNDYPNVPDESDDPAAASSIPVGTCKKVGNIVGNDGIEMFNDWLNKSGCFSVEYITEHINSIKTDPNGWYIIDYKLTLGEESISGTAFIGSREGAYFMDTVNGPLREYQVNITREMAIQNINKEKFCSVSKMYSPSLVVSDIYSDENGIEYDEAGLLWDVPGSICELRCKVDPISGEVIKRRGLCT